MKASFGVFKIVSWDLEVPVILYFAIGEPGPLIIFNQQA